MIQTPNIRMLGAAFLLALTLPLTACGENPPADAPTTTPLPNVPESRLMEGVVPSDQVETDTDPTPQSSSGGSIPGHTQTEGGTTTNPAGAPDPLPAQ